MVGLNESLCYFAVFCSVFSMLMSLGALALTIGMRLSTHKIEFKPLVTQELKEEEKFKDEEEEDKFLQSALNLQRKKKKSEDPLDTILETANF